MNDELARNVMNLNKSENAKKNLEAKLAQYEERLRALDSGQVGKYCFEKVFGLLQSFQLITIFCGPTRSLYFLAQDKTANLRIYVYFREMRRQFSTGSWQRFLKHCARQRDVTKA